MVEPRVQKPLRRAVLDLTPSSSLLLGAGAGVGTSIRRLSATMGKAKQNKHQNSGGEWEWRSLAQNSTGWTIKAADAFNVPKTARAAARCSQTGCSCMSPTSLKATAKVATWKTAHQVNFRNIRHLAGPIHKGRGRGKKSQGKGKGEGKGKGYEPQQGQAHANRHWGQDP